ncbi:MAG: flagellar biosynthetic protein FliR [Gemmatimonadetes bacterium]|nr:MAG: flagellar biosynthetic protein FliR [Gemmatimonadota bacterium]
MDVFAPGTLNAAALLLMRLTGLLLMAPVFSDRSVPGRVRAALLVLLTVCLLPVAVAADPAPDLTAAAFVTEGVVGLTLGLGAAVFIAAAQSAGDWLAVQMGLSGANVLDPHSQTQLPVVGQFMGLFVTALIVATGGHLLMLDALASSLSALPPGAPIDVQAGAFAVVGTAGRIFALGLRFAAPVVAAMMVGNAVLGVMARTVPQVNVLMVAFPVQIGIGLFTLALALPLVAAFFAGFGAEYTGVVSQTLERFVPAGGP